MCDFHSVVIYADGAMFHVPQNSHSAAVKASGRQENDGEDRRFWEWEWDGKGDKPLISKVLRGYASAPANVIRVAESHIDRLARAMNGDIDAFFVNSQYVDVLLRSPGSVLKGLTIAQGCKLWDLTSVKSLDGVKLEQGCKLGGLQGKAYTQFQNWMRTGRLE